MVIPSTSFNIWEHSEGLLKLCRERALGKAPEMDSAAQAAGILSSLELPKGALVLDGGCASGHFIHSMERRGLGLGYLGVDYSPSFIEAGRGIFESLSLDPESLALESLDEISGLDIQAAVLLNTLSFNPDCRRILDRIIENGAEALVVRDNFGPETEIRWERDGFLDEGFNHLKGYWNRWGRAEVESFLDSLGFDSMWIEDGRTKGLPEMVVGKPYTWGFLLARKRPARRPRA
jgi:SAM-dependent methyltransferase